MLASISPFGERARHNRWGTTVTAYVVGSTLGGAALGLVAGLAGWELGAAGALDRGTVAVVAGAASLAAAASDLALRGRRLPSWHRQVNEDWLARYRGWVYGIGFGTQLGFGVVTIVTTAAVYLMVLFAVLSGRVGAGTTIGAVFGLARALPVVAVARVRDPAALRRLHRRLMGAARPAAQATAATMAVVGILAVRAAA